MNENIPHYHITNVYYSYYNYGFSCCYWSFQSFSRVSCWKASTWSRSRIKYLNSKLVTAPQIIALCAYRSLRLRRMFSPSHAKNYVSHLIDSCRTQSLFTPISSPSFSHLLSFLGRLSASQQRHDSSMLRVSSMAKVEQS